MQAPRRPATKMSSAKGSESQCTGKTVDSVGSSVNVKKANLANPSGSNSQMGEPKRGYGK